MATIFTSEALSSNALVDNKNVEQKLFHAILQKI